MLRGHGSRQMGVPEGGRQTTQDHARPRDDEGGMKGDRESARGEGDDRERAVQQHSALPTGLFNRRSYLNSDMPSNRHGQSRVTLALNFTFALPCLREEKIYGTHNSSHLEYIFEIWW
jgi:hypothetical protein